MAQQPPVMFTPAQFNQLLQQLPQPAPAVAAAAMTRKITAFQSGDVSEWRTWRKNFTSAMTITGWNDQRQRLEASTAMEGEAGKVVRDIDAAAVATIAALLDQYEARFVPAAAGQYARAEFVSSEQRSDETILQWHSRARELFQRAYPARLAMDGDQQLIDQFVHNILDQVVKGYVLDQAPATFMAALNNAQSKVGNQNIMGRGKKNGNPPVVNAVAGPPRAAKPDKDKRECWHCGRAGHLKAECYKLKNEEKRKGGAKPQGGKVKGKGKDRNFGKKKKFNQMGGEEEEDGDDEEEDDEEEKGQKGN